MIKLGIVAAAVGAVLVGAAVPAAAAPAALPSYEQWQADVKKVIDPAIPWLQSRVAQGGSKLAIVLDIDNTSLETHYHFGAANKPVLAVTQWAHSHGVSVLFATARPDILPSITRWQLTNAGYTVDGLCLGKLGDSGPAATKQRCRKEYTDSGYTITENIGNRPTDMAGGNYEKGFQLPDYDGQLS
ncbi:HAD family acid phosphatase [Kutzneria albida]|uniref:Acid phosphatase of HAD superfamily subfamily IIIB n=1 Tax=Kutzneria albida DSM 43870 TaxID=1449976 RepID=W5VZ45_9PSEU|nr:HAD family acid phosphatase [Kutzneria albida]AHH93571.1 hypothetical protein KALB_194 [Kutzneria albida DSM 43870]